MAQEKSIARVTIGNSEADPVQVTLPEVGQVVGTDIEGASMPNDGSGVLGWLSAIYMFLTGRLPTLVSGRVPVDVASLSVTVTNTQLEITNDEGNPIPAELIGETATSITNIEQSIGSNITSATIPSGGSGIIGWLSAIYAAFTGRIPALVNGRLPVDVASLSVSVANAQLEISNDSGNPITVTLPTGTATAGFISVAGAGTVAAGNISVSICNFGSNQGTLLGASFPSGATINFAAPNGQKIGAISYDASNTIYLISSLQ